MEGINEINHPTLAQTTGSPASDPLSGAFVPPVVSHVPVVGGTGAADPIIGSTVGGLPAIFAMATGISSSIASKMYEEALLRTLAFTSTTARGTILDTITFNPFSPSCVNSAAALYGSIHTQFTGSVFISVETVANSTLMGRIAICYVPSLYGEDVTITPENLFLFDHSILDVSASGKGTFEMKPTTDSQFIVKNGDGKYYGKLVILAFTDVANSFGTTMNIPLNVYSRLSPDAMYSGMMLATLPSAGANAAEFGILPSFPTTQNATLITEAVEPMRQDAFVKEQAATGRSIARGQHFEGFKWTDKDDLTSSELSVQQYFGVVPNDNLSLIVKSDEEAYYYTHSCSYNSGDPSNIVRDIDLLFKDSHLQSGYSATILYDRTLGVKQIEMAPGLLQAASGTVTIDMAPTGVLQFLGYCRDITGKRREIAQIKYVANQSITLPKPQGFNYLNIPPAKNSLASYIPEDLVVTSGRINTGVAAPLGYRAIRIVDAGNSIAAVKPGVIGETHMYGVETTEFYLQVMEYLRKNSSIKSVTYTVNYTNGDLIADILVNKHGMWMASSGVDPYSLFLGELSYSVSQAVRNTTEWTKLRSANATYWSSREFSARGQYRNGNKVVRCLKAQMMAAIVGGAAMGVGSGLADLGERKYLRKMQDDRQAHAFNMLGTTFERKNWLAQQDYERKFASQVATTKTVQSRNERPTSVNFTPATSQEAMDQTDPIDAWSKEVKSKPDLYKLVSGDEKRKVVNHSWDQSNALQAVSSHFADVKKPGNFKPNLPVSKINEARNTHVNTKGKGIEKPPGHVAIEMPEDHEDMTGIDGHVPDTVNYHDLPGKSVVSPGASSVPTPATRTQHTTPVRPTKTPVPTPRLTHIEHFV